VTGCFPKNVERADRTVPVLPIEIIFWAIWRDHAGLLYVRFRLEKVVDMVLPAGFPTR